MQIVKGADTPHKLEVPIEQFEAAAKSMNVHDLDPFLKSRNFTQNFNISGSNIVKGLGM